MLWFGSSDKLLFIDNKFARQIISHYVSQYACLYDSSAPWMIRLQWTHHLWSFSNFVRSFIILCSLWNYRDDRFFSLYRINERNTGFQCNARLRGIRFGFFSSVNKNQKNSFFQKEFLASFSIGNDGFTRALARSQWSWLKERERERKKSASLKKCNVVERTWQPVRQLAIILAAKPITVTNNQINSNADTDCAHMN